MQNINKFENGESVFKQIRYFLELVDKKYKDEDIYEFFGFTYEEINLIEKTIKKYDRYSPWFIRYMCGPSSVTDEEV